MIAHQALSVASDATTIKYLEVIILNCWNHPIMFDVHDFFDLDYNLLQSVDNCVCCHLRGRSGSNTVGNHEHPKLLQVRSTTSTGHVGDSNSLKPFPDNADHFAKTRVKSVYILIVRL
ncbi:Hypothetical protein CINCED_3A025706 [Cinara cedri]|uniref:Uncharacterized protein n=1 Tax=Cinara cedri TaxID=506608 RepID=A0A5E4MR99_9HEMI|nr:Hypothetical protein CINCED_3A025706 [Cinara cedri]